MLQHHLSKERLEFFHGLVEGEAARPHVKGRPVAMLGQPPGVEVETLTS
jgi:DNA primase